MAKGDHIYRRMSISMGMTYHHGIDCGDGTVIHYDGKTVRRVSKYEFAEGKEILTEEYGKCDSPEVVVTRAISKLGEQKYCLVGNNCEHFAYYCKTGQHKSEQVNQAQARTAGLAGGTAIGIGTKVAIQAASVAAKQSLNPISKTLVNVGLKQAPRVAGGIAGAGGIASGIATDLVVGKILEDDEHLPKHEREARKNGREAGQVASTLGGIAGTVAAATLGGSAAIATAVAAPVVLGMAAAFGVYLWSQGDQE
ncbi:lecithin retinol acyltransferase family protein [Calothrix sp. PCC 7507]|uniref:lecithin retinol acyltransferase family protein n=1 Tax=Calothrix sp. PCC 7507 TaxID=99598 RepID=UPI00029EDF63|nr:lecithin retinol acyltransferase family protein [Calothrix sp. PCC 7507]AFY35017.1 NC domain protein [Calothrix sp. PCC 7507]